MFNFVVLGFVILFLGLHLAGFWWIYADAKAMGEEQPALWIVLAVFVSLPVGLILYLLMVRQGKWCCPSCGAQNRKGDVFCSRCAEKHVASKAENGPPKWPLALILGLMVVLVVTFFLFFFASLQSVQELGGHLCMQWHWG